MPSAPQAPTPAYRVAIIGAGPAGSTLARLLLKSNVDLTIFEGEASPQVRSQGGTLDLHEDTGQAALRKAGLYDEFVKLARFDSDSMVVCDKQLRKYLSIGSSERWSRFTNGRPEIDREQLRLLLLNSLPPTLIRWGWRLQRVDADDLSLHFENGAVERGFDLVVGADGAWSKTRTVLTTVRPVYTGVGGHSFSVPDAAEKWPALYKLVNRGSLFAFSDGMSLTGQQMGDGSLLVSLYSVRGENWMEEAGYDVLDGKAAKEAYCKEYQGWSPELTDMIRAVDDGHTLARSLYILPVGNKWESRPGITLLGDAAHLMTPYAGEGVNAAMKDAIDLADAINGANAAEGTAGLHKRVEEFERSMLERTRQSQAISLDLMEMMFFVEGAPRTVIEKYIVRAISDGVPAVTLPALRLGVYVFYFFIKLFI